MNLSDYKNTIFLVKDSAKDSILEKISKENKLLNIKIITLTEFKNKYFFTYTKEAIYYIVNKYNVIPEIAKIYIDNIYYIKESDNEKIIFLKKLQKELEEQNLLQKNDMFKSFLESKKIVLYNLSDVDSFYQNIFEQLKSRTEVIMWEDSNPATIKPLYKATNKEEEIVFIASEISNLIKKGIDINKIKIANLQNDYFFSLKKTFTQFKIPVEIPVETSIEGTLIVKKFKELFESDIKNTVTNLREFIKDPNDEKIYNKIISILNEYAWVDDYNKVRNLIFSDLSKIKPPQKKLKNAVRLIDFPDDIIAEDEYVYLVNFNQGVIPINSKNEDYLSDKIKSTIGISTSIDLNTKKIRAVQKKIQETSNLVVTYSDHNLTSKIYISNAYDSKLFEEKSIVENFENSHEYNKLKLLSLKDEHKKFGTVTDSLILLNNYYKNEGYCTYNNQFKGIDLVKLNDHLKNKLVLSYSSMNAYYECSFKYYLNYILKVDKYEDSFATIIGNIFHKILSECFCENYNFDSAWNNVIDNIEYKFNNTENFFLTTLKDELYLVIETIKKQMEYSSLKKVLYEKEVIVPIDKNVNIIFKGFIDKILYDNFDDITIAVIIDYKTGDPELSLNNIPYGLEMQLPVYMYLLKKSSKNQNIRIGGFYLQKILNNIDDREKRIDSLKLQGYSSSDIDILKKVDSSYSNSQVIKSLKTTSSGFSSYAKIMSDHEMNLLADIVDDKIKEAANNILKGNFKINPKQIGDKLIGCKFCKFRDICYFKNADIEKLKKITKEDFLGGESDAKMDS